MSFGVDLKGDIGGLHKGSQERVGGAWLDTLGFPVDSRGRVLKRL